MELFLLQGIYCKVLQFVYTLPWLKIHLCYGSAVGEDNFEHNWPAKLVEMLSYLYTNKINKFLSIYLFFIFFNFQNIKINSIRFTNYKDCKYKSYKNDGSKEKHTAMQSQGEPDYRKNL